MVQTKIDLIDNAVITQKETEQLAKKLQLPIFRICSKDNVMVTEVFEYLAVKYFSKNMHKQEGHHPIQSLGDIKANSMSTSLASWNNQSNQNQTIQQNNRSAGGGGTQNNISRSSNNNGGAVSRGNIKLGAAFNSKDKDTGNKKNRWFSSKCAIL
eukprot:403365591